MSEIEERLSRAIPRIARRMQNELVLASPVNTGRLRNSIKVESTNKGIVITIVDYAMFVEFGTPPHLIKPKNKKSLKFKGDAGDVFAKEVKHPGTRPNPFIRNTINNKMQQIIMEELTR